MGWGWWGGWPGRGPFSYLPPWQRPGWVFGRGSCWWLLGGPWAPYYLAPYYWAGYAAPYAYYYYPAPWPIRYWWP